MFLLGARWMGGCSVHTSSRTRANTRLLHHLALCFQMADSGAAPSDTCQSVHASLIVIIVMQWHVCADSQLQLAGLCLVGRAMSLSPELRGELLGHRGFDPQKAESTNRSRCQKKKKKRLKTSGLL